MARALEALYAPGARLGAGQRDPLDPSAARPVGRLEEHAAELAEHFAQSTDADLAKAVHYSEQAARRATSVYAYGEAARFLEGALEVQEVLDPGRPGRRCDLLLALGEALGPAGEAKRAAEEIAPAALTLAEGLGDDQRAFQACRIAVEGIRRYGGARVERSPEFGQWSERARRYAAPGTTQQVCAEDAAANHLFVTGRREEARRLNSQALELARQLGDGEGLVRSAIQVVMWWGPQYSEERRRLIEELSRGTWEGVSVRLVGQLLWYSAIRYLEWGERDQFEELANRTREPSLLWRPTIRDLILATLDGCLEEALGVVDRATHQAEELGVEQSATLARSMSVQVLLYLGRAEEALEAAPGSTAKVVCAQAHLGRTSAAREELKHWLQAPPDPADLRGTSAHR